jgi:hypothetical protein
MRNLDGVVATALAFKPHDLSAHLIMFRTPKKPSGACPHGIDMVVYTPFTYTVEIGRKSNNSFPRRLASRYECSSTIQDVLSVVRFHRSTPPT